jgi:hypothetical protein
MLSIFTVVAKYYWESEPEVKERKREPCLKEANEYLDRLEKHVVQNGGHFVKDQVMLILRIGTFNSRGNKIIKLFLSLQKTNVDLYIMFKILQMKQF